MIRSLAGKGVRVPGGFATTAAAYWRFVDENALGSRVTALLDDYEGRRRALAETGHAIPKCVPTRRMAKRPGRSDP